MSKKLFLAVLPFLALAMASCSRGNGGAGSSSGKTSESSEPTSEESSGSEGSEDSSESSEEDSRAHSEPSTEGVDFKIGDAYFPMEEIDPDADETTVVHKYSVSGVSVQKDATVSFYKDGTVVPVFLNVEDLINKNNTNERPGSSTPAESYTVHNDATSDIYIMFHNNDSVAFWITGYQEGSEDVDPDAPTQGYAIVVTTGGEKSYTAAVENGTTWDGKTEYFASGVTVANGSVITCYDAGAIGGPVEWAITALNTASTAGFSAEADGIHSTVDGTYDIYIQLQYRNDTIYVGPHSAA